MAVPFKKTRLTLVYVFILAFFFNFLWEHLHAPLYLNYKGGYLTEMILLHATFVDALIITGLAALFLRYPFLRQRRSLVILFGFCIAVIIEWWALGTGRWAYTQSMPLIPLLHVGFSPAVQLSSTGYVVFLLLF